MDMNRTHLHAAALRRAHALRDAAIDEAWARLATWLRRLLHKEGAPCRS